MEPQIAEKSVSEEELKHLYKTYTDASANLLAAIRSQPRQEVKDYELTNTDGSKVRLSELFGDKDELMVVHNMGKGCVYCTLWADGFNGVHQHLSDRAAFVLSSPDDHETQRAFAESRGWKFRTVSIKDTTFAKDLGFEPKPKSYQPGFSTFIKDADGKMYRTAKDMFGPGDHYCATWHLLDLLPNGQNGWEPKYKY